MTPQELKNSILRLAFQGKLVPQNPSEGTGEELYKQIQEEKIRLIKEKSIRKEKLFAEIGDDEISFDIPENWMWVRANNIISLLSGADLDPSKYNSAEKGIPYITGASNIDKNNIIINRWTEFPKNVATKGDLLLTCKGTVGKTAILKEGKVHIARQIMAIRPIIVDIVFFQYFIESQIKYLKSKAKSMIPGIERDNVLKLIFPLPPLAEQKRIVAKIEELLPLIDRYEEAYNKLEELNKIFPLDLQKSILQMAIQGKLVPQDPSEGTGEDLYKQIQEEKKANVNAGKIKKEKPLPSITEEDVIFDIPESWIWCYVGDIFQHNTGKALNGSDKSGTPMTYITTSNLYWDRFELDKLKIMPFTENEIEKCTVKKGDLLVCEGGDFGRSAIWPYDNPIRIQNHIHRLRAYGTVSIRYFYYIFYLYKNTGLIAGKGIAIQGLSSNALHTLKIPLPPLDEQKRIVAKLEKLLPLCEKLGF